MGIVHRLVWVYAGCALMAGCVTTTASKPGRAEVAAKAPAGDSTMLLARARTAAAPVAAPPETAPGWVRSLGTQSAYSGTNFITGFGMSAADAATSLPDKMAYARNMAYASLVSAMRVHLTSEDCVRQLSQIVNGREQIVDEYKSRVTSRSDMSVDGLRFEEYTDRPAGVAYAIAYLNKPDARQHYQQKFVSKMQQLLELQDKGNEQLAAKNVAAARGTYQACDRLVGDIEEIIMIQELLGGAEKISKDDLAKIVRVRTQSAELWEKTADTLDEAAEQLAMKLGCQTLMPGRVQVNAPMLDDTYQYSQFSSRFRFILEKAVTQRTNLKPMLLSESDFVPDSSGIARYKARSGGADYMLSGSYFLRDDSVQFYLQLLNIKSNAVVASAGAQMAKAAAGDLELKPRNYLQALEDKRVLTKNELVGGSLNLEAWTGRGVEGLVLEDGTELKVYVRVNQPCYLRFFYLLNNGARIVPNDLYLNYYIGNDKVNQVVELPDTFQICAPFGADTMQFFASTERFPDVDLVTKFFDGESYQVLADSLAQNTAKTRGLKVVKKTGKAVEVAERRINLTTVKK